MWIEPATVPPRKPSFVAVASSWMLPFASLLIFREVRSGPEITPSRVVNEE
jgi:hypothetical protein